MDSELDSYVESVNGCLQRVADVVASMDTRALNARPPTSDGNSAYVIATHVVGNARAWIVGIVAGEPIGRDRPAEFASRGDDAAGLLASINDMQATVASKLAALDPGRLEARFVPAQELWGEGKPREISVRDAILHVVEHASLHQGHLQLTRDLVEAAIARR